MDGPVLVTGGTGTLGREVVARLRAAGTAYRVLSRRGGDGAVVGDLASGAGIDDAVRGAATILHLASGPRHDIALTRTLVDAALHASRVGHGRPHLVYISIVGVDRVPLGYYRQKLASEGLVAGSGLPWTTLRATQFHNLLDALFASASRIGVLPVLAGAVFQPVDVQDVATRLVELAAAEPAGQVLQLGGPAVRPMDELARAWLRARGRSRRVPPLPLPGGLARAVRAGGLTAPDQPRGTGTFEQYLKFVSGCSDMRMATTHRIALIPGDGIGAEVTPAACAVLDAVGAAGTPSTFGYDEFDWSCTRYLAEGAMMPADGLDQVRGHDAILLGAVGGPGVPDHESLWGLLIPIRRVLPAVREPAPGPARSRACASPLPGARPGTSTSWWSGRTSRASTARSAAGTTAACGASWPCRRRCSPGPA